MTDDSFEHLREWVGKKEIRDDTIAAWPIVALTTAAGDCTVHYSHTLHGAPPPTGGLGLGEHGRRTIYACFAPPSLFDALQPLEDLVAVMQRADGVTMTVDEKLAKM